MAGHPMYLQYVKPVVSGIDGVFSLIEGIDVLKCFVPDLREHYEDCPVTSLPSVTEKKLSEVLKPNSFELVRKLSKALVFSSPKETITIYLVFEIESYVAVIKSRRKVSVKLLSQYSGKKYPIGTHKLFDLLKKRHMISPSFEEYQPKYYDPLDFDELACRLEGFLEPDVSLVVNHRLPSAEELDGKHTTWYDDGTVFSPVTIDVINMSDECYLILVMFKYELKETFDILISDHKFENHRPSFSGADIIEDLLYED